MSDLHAPLSTLVSRVQGGGTPARSVSENWRGPIPWASVKDLSRHQFDIADTIEHISRKGLASSAANLIPAGVPIVSTRMAVGKTVIPTVDIAINQDLKALYPAAHVDSRYLTHALQFIEPRVDAVSVGSTVRGISVSQLMRFRVFCPRYSEQRRIAEVLDTVDDQIRATEDIVAKLNTVRTGVSRDLFRVSLDADWQPQDWKLVELGSLLLGIDAGKSPDCPNTPAAAGQWGVLKVSAIGASGFMENENKAIPPVFPVPQSAEVHLGDVLMTRANTPDLVGMACIVRQQPMARLMLSDKTWRIRSMNLVNDEFLAEVLRSAPVRRFVQATATGTSGSMKNISQTALKRALVPLPSPAEQLRIMSILTAQENRASEERRLLAGLVSLKQGLMADLLSGRVRIVTETIS